MGIDTSMYSNFKLPDFVGSFQEGKAWRQKQDALAKQKQIDDVKKSMYVMGADGKLALNPEGQKQLAQLAPEQAYQAQSQMDQVARQKMLDEQNQKYRYDDLAQKALDRKEARDERRFQAGIKLDEQMQGLKTPYGLANTVDDAKQLKEAHEAKSNFDNKLDQMIALRKKHNGGAILNRDDVGVGQQLSKDLLLEYKNMAKLGVLSQADENIINAIIPKDPLEYSSPLAALQGQDPIMAKLTTFKQNANKDFQTRVGTRTRSGVEGGAISFNPSADAPPNQDSSLFPSAHASELPKKGAMEGGYVFKGGNPADPKSWGKIK